MSKGVKSELFTIPEKGKAKCEAESVTTDAVKSYCPQELAIFKEEKAELKNELIIAKKEIVKRSDELIIANEEKAKRAAELVIANEEKTERAAELVIANEEKGKRAAELVIANAEKAKRAAELVIANSEKVKRAAVLVIANLEKAKRAEELIIADKELAYQTEEKVKRAAELVIADVNKTKREAELVIAKIEKAKRIAKSIIADKELSFQTEEKSKRAAELVIADAEKAKREAELVIANIKKANRSAELIIANVEKAKRSAELIIANKELVYQKSEKAKRAAELIIANVEKANRAAELVVANIEKANRAAELVVTNKELELAIERAKLTAELIIVNKELNLQINERKLAEDALLHSNTFSESLLKTIPFEMDIVDETGTVLFQSDNFKKLFGEDVIGRKCWDLYRDDKEQCCDCPLFKGIIIGETATYESHGVLGNRIFEISHTGMMYHGKRAMLEIFQDITERKQSEEKVQMNEIYLKETQIIANLGTYTMEVKSGKWTSSEILDRIFGIDSDYDKSVEGWISLIHPEWQKAMSNYFINEVIGNKTNFGKQYKIIRKNDKAERWVQGFGNLKINENDQPITMIGTIQDITEHKEREKQLEEALEKAKESDRLKSAFLTNMSHEIRTPMNGILGFTELLKEPSLTAEEQQEFIKTIWISGERMLNTINNIVDVSKIESGLSIVHIKETDINDKMMFTYKFFKPEVETKGLQFLYKNGLPTKDAIIMTDNEKVYEILTNLIKNAIKFTHDGSVEFGYEKKGAYLEFYVKDTGIGIGEKHKEFIFERFIQVSDDLNRLYEGSGLGLSISKSYIEMLGGRIWAESEEGSGSTFYFTIPYTPVLEETSAFENIVSAENRKVQERKLKILIVEDDEISYSLLSITIQKISKEVLHAITGIEAVEACRNNPDIDLILMDIRMPRMNGLEATQIIRQFNKDVIIIAQTAYGFSSDYEKALEAGCNDYITKPINRTLLFELITKHFNTKE